MVCGFMPKRADARNGFLCQALPSYRAREYSLPSQKSSTLRNVRFKTANLKQEKANCYSNS